jgi:hypothetical protein
MASAINLSNLSEYVEQRSDELLTSAILGAKTLDVIDVMLDVKYTAPLNYLDTTVVFGDASTCGWNPQGEDEFTQRTIEVHPVKVNKEWCARDMRKYWMNYQLLIDAQRETLPFEEKIVDENIKAINIELEKEIWTNDASALFPGFLYVLEDEGAETADASNATDAVDAAYANITDEMYAHDGVTMFMDPTLYRNFISEANAVCCANRDMLDAASDYITYPGDSRVTMRPTAGLAGTKKVVVTWAKNLVFGTDVEGSENDYKVWYDDKDEMTRFKVLFNAGVQVKFPDQAAIITVE